MKCGSIVFVGTDLRVGGAEKLRVAVCQELHARGTPFTICLLEDEGELAGKLREDGIRIEVLGVSRSIYDLRSTFRLARLLRAERPRVVHSGQFNSNFHARVATKIARIRAAVICEEHGFHGWKKWRHRAIDRWLSSWCDRIIAVSQAVKKHNVTTIGIPADKIVVVKNCIDLKQYAPDDRKAIRSGLGLSDEDFVIGHVATLRREKGHPVLLAAARQLAENVKVVLIGDGPMNHEIRQMVRDLKIEDRVLMLGERSDVPRLLAALDVFAFPSESEGLGIALLEAMGAELPVVASRVGGIPEIVEDGVTGLLVPPGDPGALAAAFERLAGDPSLRGSLGARARAHVTERHSVEDYVERLLHLYREVVRA